ncbi:DUF4440 domain-containing protein [Chitinophaga sp. XS-30]|uniref:YybH family protein n=1 Tax=Chitinophaga sp. XS-30 TaxID=2604421 RepID=UPI0011DCB271|nr:DUF4440 domain-containing protein [Chitinophaga sp. XS-30]QEH40073.1 DUF4440 domain-containing protein [Chitinophaga sp. XS-30]
MRSLVIIIAIFTLTGPLQVAAQSNDIASIRTLMDAQTSAWNAGDIDGFMATYWQSDSLLFVGKNGVTYGWKGTLANYKKNYPDKTAMGTLSFNLLEFKKLAADVYFVVGKWHLARTIGDLSGHFTLVIRRIGGEWKIVADHSS